MIEGEGRHFPRGGEERRFQKAGEVADLHACLSCRCQTA
jgi:hypothetical protein